MDLETYSLRVRCKVNFLRLDSVGDCSKLHCILISPPPSSLPMPLSHPASSYPFQQLAGANIFTTATAAGNSCAGISSHKFAYTIVVPSILAIIFFLRVYLPSLSLSQPPFCIRCTRSKGMTTQQSTVITGCTGTSDGCRRHHYQLSTKLICCSLALVATKHLQLPLELPPDLAVGNHQINGVTQ